jgi:ABC-type dipeptide/oligopeptide/nickel transport system permease subunit
MQHSAMSKRELEEIRLPAAEQVQQPAPTRVRSESLFIQMARRLQRSKTAIFGLSIVVLLLVVALLADVLAPYSPIHNSPRETFQHPSSQHWLGTDQFGRDMLSCLIYGSRISLAVGLSSVLLAIFTGVPLGIISGFYGGQIDALVMRLMELILVFPVFLLAIILMVMFTPTAGVLGTVKVASAIAIVRIPIFARLVRGSMLSIKEKEFVEACRAVGQRDVKILFRHILPNCMAPRVFSGSAPNPRHRSGDGISRRTSSGSTANPGWLLALGWPFSSPSWASTSSATVCGMPSIRG